LFLVHPIGGGILCYAPAVEIFKTDFDVFGIQSLTFQEEDAPARSLAQMAAAYAARVATAGKGREVRLMGWSMGGLLSILMKPHLEAKGFQVRVVALDPWVARNGIGPEDALPEKVIPEFFNDLTAGGVLGTGYTFRNRDPGRMLEEYRDHLEASGARLPRLDARGLSDLYAEYVRNLTAILGHQAQEPGDGVHAYVAGKEDPARFRFLRPLTNGRRGEGSPGITRVDETHFTIVSEAFLRPFKPRIREFFAPSSRESRT
jgi:thioesterase domain-containing protein